MACVGLALAAVSPKLVFFSQELKQYECDALVTLSLLWLGLLVLVRAHPVTWLKLAAWGCAAIVVSQPSVFVLAAIVVGSALDCRFRNSAQWRRGCMTASASWLAVFASLYFFSYRQVAHSAYMQAYWSGTFLDPRVPGWYHRVIAALSAALDLTELGLPRPLLAGLFAIGLVAIFRRTSLAGLLMAVGPYLSVFCASALRLYPIEARLLLFTAPLLLWIYASAICWMASLAPRRLETVAAGLTLATLAATFGTIPAFIGGLRFIDPCRQVISKINSTDRSAPVYIAEGWHVLNWEYYGGDWNQPYQLKKRADIGFRTIYRRLVPGDSGLTETTLWANRIEIVGAFPPSSAAEAPTTAAREARRIRAETDQAGRVWIFSMSGQRRWLYLLRQEIEGNGAHLANDSSFGNAMAVEYVWPDATYRSSGAGRTPGVEGRVQGGAVVDSRQP